MNAQDTAREVRKQYARYDERARSWLSAYTGRGGRVYCASGCFRCCDMPIRLSWPEALTIAQSMSEDQHRDMHAHARKVWANAHCAKNLDEYVRGHRSQVGFCPLLDRATGSCSQYADRPTRCRDTYSGLPAQLCAPGGVEGLKGQARRDYQREVRTNPAMDGHSHYLAPLEDLSLPAWDRFGAMMRRELGFELWGDFAFLVCMTREEDFVKALQERDPGKVIRALRKAGLYHPEIVQIE
ncbi:YkgJ family cysteine cluster protein [Deinococcus peraridilitoris]|uniref:Uncharacterized protein family (UPF0153) n=1 Tax=Deinococcus peraridilitoris (strain DSM 19664 / LMG 22246 / CIP 109416 / KR-200) TaxID=937777 RepID=L0A6L3_DEIPD|nr:YkgJ family cysteine cluster protein [Deinococcus peraridilitoris]AFZ68645.1 Uncharacterized protein family (UPF0153) [Deinococcus peraridilitoris DSM 19664]